MVWSYSTEYPLGQLWSAVLAASTPSLLPTPSLPDFRVPGKRQTKPSQHANTVQQQPSHLCVPKADQPLMQSTAPYGLLSQPDQHRRSVPQAASSPRSAYCNSCVVIVSQEKCLTVKRLGRKPSQQYQSRCDLLERKALSLTQVRRQSWAVTLKCLHGGNFRS